MYSRWSICSSGSPGDGLADSLAEAEGDTLAL